MRILSKLIFVVLLPFLFTACQSYKKVPYLQDTEVINQTEQKENCTMQRSCLKIC